MSNFIVKEVSFENVNMTACKTVEGNAFVGIRSICEGLGVAYNGQMERINRDDVLPEGVRKIRIPTSSGEQEVNMLDIEYLPFFLTGIKSSMCREEIRPRIKEFKLKAKDVLAEAFLGKKATCMEDILIQQLQEMKSIRLQVQETKEQVAVTTEKTEVLEKRFNNLIDIDLSKPKTVAFNEYMRRYAIECRKSDFKQAWKDFDDAFYYATGMKVKIRAQNANITTPKWLDANGYIDMAIRIADNLLNKNLN